VFFLISDSRVDRLQLHRVADNLPPILRNNLAAESSCDSRYTVTYSTLQGAAKIRLEHTATGFILAAGHPRLLGRSLPATPSELMLTLSSSTPQLGGQFLVVVYDSRSETFEAYTSLARLIPGYVARHGGGIAISTRQLALADLFEIHDVDASALHPFLGQGYVPSEQALVRGVSLLPANARTVISCDDFSSAAIDATLLNTGMSQLNDDTADGVSDALRRAFNPIARGDIDIGLTGGRDSRLIAALLSREDVPFTTYTIGTPDDAEVQVAQIVATTLGVPHRIVAPSPGRNAKQHTVDLTRRIIEVMTNTDLSVFAHDSLGGAPRTFDGNTLTYNGGGGELLRTAYGREAWLSAEKAERRIRAHAAGAEYLAERRSSGYGAWLDSWLVDHSHLSPAGLLKTFSLLFRTGRWGSGVFMSRHSRVSQRPFYDNELLAHVLPLSDDLVATEALYYEILRRNAPKLLSVPYSSGEWGLRHSSSPHYRAIAESLPMSLRASSPNVTVVTSWRRHVNGPLGVRLMQIIDECRRLSPGIDEAVSVAALRRFLIESPDSRPPVTSTVKRLWSTASYAVGQVMLDGKTAELLESSRVDELPDSVDF